MAERVRILDIAQRAGVSAATVSRVLNAPDRVRPETRASIHEALRVLNYVPQANHRDERTGRGVLGFFAPNFELDSAIEMLRRVEAELALTSFDVLIVNMRGNRDLHAFISSNPHIVRKVDAAIVFSADVSEAATRFMDGAAVPIVLMQARSACVHAVSNNNFCGGQDAARHLVDCGYRSLAFIGWTPNDDHCSDRLAGFRDVLRSTPEGVGDAGAVCGTLDARGGYEATRILLDRSRPDAIFYASDMMAFGGMRYLREAAISVPDEIGLIGFDDLAIAEAVGLTTMRQFFATKARMVVSYILDRLDPDKATPPRQDVQVAPQLVVRETTKQLEVPFAPNNGSNAVVGGKSKRRKR